MKLKFLSNERFRKNVYKKYWYNKDLAFFFRGFHLYRDIEMVLWNLLFH